MSAQLIQEAITANKVVIFSKTFCPYCAKAKSALSQYLPADKVYVVELDERQDGISIQDAMVGITGGRSVPRVFIGGKFVGGGDDTARLAQTGELKGLLEAAGVL